MMIDNRKNFYTLLCYEWNAYGGGLVVHVEVNVGSVIEAHEYVLAHLYDFPYGTWVLKPSLTR